MIVLLSFAVLAGAGTALSPCVLPVLPALLSAGSPSTREQLAAPAQKHLITETRHHHSHSAMNFRKALVPYWKNAAQAGQDILR